MHRIISAIIFLLILVVPIEANEFNQLYNKGQYDQALEILQNKKEISFTKFYNMGNCYYRLGLKGKALQYYKKAEILFPRDKDLKHNIAIVKSMLEDEDTAEKSFIIRLWELFINLFSFNEVSLFILILHITALVVLITFFRSDKQKQLITILIVLLFSVVWITKYMSYEHHKRAVLVASNSEVLSSPAIESSILFSLHEGTEFIILESYNDWYRIGLKSGLSGWLKKQSAGRINPL